MGDIAEIFKTIAACICGILIMYFIVTSDVFPLIGDEKDLELHVHDLINQERIKNGLGPLKFDPALAEIARKHSQDMAENNYLEHNNYAGEDPSDRATKAGYSCYKSYGLTYSTGIAENIEKNQLSLFDFIYLNAFDHLSISIVNEWMNSYGHKQNILSISYDREGIGIARYRGALYITEDFC